MAETFRTWEDYFIPGTEVLRNKFGQTDQMGLSVREQAVTALRLAELTTRPIEGGFDYDHMKAVHRHIFQDVYEWAGHERVAPLTPMTKTGPDVVNYPPGDSAAPWVAYAYYPAPAIAEAARAQYAQLAKDSHLTGLDRDTFVGKLAEHWGEINTIHAFREGNTRSQFAFFSQLAQNAGYRIDGAQFAVGAPLREPFVQARFYNQATGRADRLEAVLTQAITPDPRAAESTAGGQDLSVAQQYGLRGVGASFPRTPRPVVGPASPAVSATKTTSARGYGIER